MIEKKYFYIGKKEALNNESLIFKISSKKINNFKDIYGDNCVEFFGENLPYYVTIDGDIAREATLVDLYNRGVYKLQEHEFVKDGVIYNIYDFEVSSDIILPVFDKNEMKWVESATPEDISLFWWNKCIECSQEILNIEKAGFEGGIKHIELNNKLDEYREKYINVNHELALNIDAGYRSL